MKKEDMRTKRTKKALKTSLIKLMYTETIDNISVTDICGDAEVNRVTFYTHYSDKFSLLYEVLHDLINIIHKHTKDYLAANKTNDPIKDYTNSMSHAVYKMCFENKSFIKSLSKKENSVLIEMIDEIMIKEGIKCLIKVEPIIKSNFPPKFTISFLLGGFSKLIFDYCLNEENITEQEFFTHFEKLFYSIIKSEILFTTNKK